MFLYLRQIKIHILRHFSKWSRVINLRQRFIGNTRDFAIQLDAVLHLYCQRFYTFLVFKCIHTSFDFEQVLMDLYFVVKSKK